MRYLAPFFPDGQSDDLRVITPCASVGQGVQHGLGIYRGGWFDFVYRYAKAWSPPWGGLDVSGNYNNAFGYSALGNTTGSNNVGIGHQALASNTTASNNTAVGYQALNANTTGVENTAVGYQALVANTTASYNTAVGRNSLVACTTGTHNTVIGHNSGDTITTGTKNTILGRYNGNQGGLDIRTSSNRIVLSDGDGNPRVYTDSNGRWIFATNYAGELITSNCNRRVGINGS